VHLQDLLAADTSGFGTRLPSKRPAAAAPIESRAVGRGDQDDALVGLKPSISKNWLSVCLALVVAAAEPGAAMADETASISSMKMMQVRSLRLLDMSRTREAPDAHGNISTKSSPKW